MTVRLLLLFALTSLVATGASAQSAPSGLYDAHVEVASQSDSDRARGTREGLGEVLARLTGRPDAAEQTEVRDLLENADRYVEQFGYDTVADDGGEQLLLRLRFDGRSLQRALADREVAVWAEADRPRVLVWLAVERDGGREIAGGETAPDIQDALRAAAADYGLPVLFPLRDLEDRQRVTSSDVWGGFREPILEASERYRAEVVLVGRLEGRADAYQARWLLLWEDDVAEWSASGEDLDAAALSGPAGATERLARDLARPPGERVTGNVTLRIDGVEALDGFSYLRRLLAATRGVGDVEVLRAEGESVYLRIRLEGDSERLVRDLERGGRLERVSLDMDGPPDPTAPGVDMGFRLGD